MADVLFERDVAEEREERGRERWMADPGARVLLEEVEGLIADRLGRGNASEWEMWTLDGVPASIVFEAADRLGSRPEAGCGGCGGGRDGDGLAEPQN